MSRRPRAARRPRGRSLRGCRRVEHEGQGAVGLPRTEMGPDHQGLGGHRGPYRLDDGGIGQRFGGRPSLGQRQQGGAGQLEGDGTGEVQHDRVRLLVRGGLQHLAQGYGDGAGRGVPAGQRVRGGEGGQRRAVPALRVGTAMSLVFSWRSPFSSSSTSPRTATTGTSSRASLRASRTGGTAERSADQAASAALSRGSAEPSSSGKPESGMFLFATVPDPIGGMLLRLCGPRNPAVTGFTGFSVFADTALTRV